MEPKDRAFQAGFWSRDSVCVICAWRLNKTWSFSHAFSNIRTSRLHFTAVSPKLHSGFFFFFFQYLTFSRSSHSEQGLRFCCGNWELQGSLIIIGQQGINGNTRGKHLRHIYCLFLWWLVTVTSGGDSVYILCRPPTQSSHLNTVRCELQFQLNTGGRDFNLTLFNQQSCETSCTINFTRV